MSTQAPTPTLERTNDTEPAAAPKAGKQKTNHAYWVEDMKVAEEMGVYCRALCGFWVPPQYRPEDREKPRPPVPTVDGAGVVPTPGPKDCKNCMRAFAAARRRQHAEEYR